MNAITPTITAADPDPAYIVQFRTPAGSWFLSEEAACSDLAGAVSEAAEMLGNWPDIRAWATPADEPIRDATAQVKRALAAACEANGETFDTIHTALIDYASPELRAAHAADQAEQLWAECWAEEVA